MALTAKTYDRSGNEAGTVELADALFGRKVNEAALHAYVKMFLGNKRQGTAKTKTRSEVSGSGKKPFRQKGTGRARQGTRTSPLMPGGGRAFGPRPRSHRTRLPKKMRRLAMVSALSQKALDEAVSIIDPIPMEAPKTKDAVAILNNMGIGDRKVLFLDEAYADALWKSFRNLPKVRFGRGLLANAYEVLNAQELVITRTALDKMQEVLAS